MRVDKPVQICNELIPTDDELRCTLYKQKLRCKLGFHKYKFKEQDYIYDIYYCILCGKEHIEINCSPRTIWGIRMKFVRQGKDVYRIFPESDEEQKQLEESLGWKEKGTLMEIICQLKGYGTKGKDEVS